MSFTLKGACDIDLVMFPVADIRNLLIFEDNSLSLTSQRSRAYEIDWKTTIQLTHYLYLQSPDIKEGMSEQISFLI